MPSTFDYNPQAKYEVRSFDVPYQEALGQPWEATIYQPEGDGAVSCHSLRPRRRLERGNPHWSRDIQHRTRRQRFGDCIN